MVKKILKYKPLKIAVIILAIAGVALIANLAVRQQASRNTKAAGGNAALSIQPSAITSQVNNTGTMNVFVTPSGEKVNSLELHVSYDPAIIQITNIAPGNFFSDHTATVGAPQEIIKNISTPGKIYYAVAFPLGSKMPGTNESFYSTATGAMAVISYKVLANTNGPSNITIGIAAPTETLISDINAQNVRGTVTNATITVGNTATSTPTVTSTRTPTPSVNPGTLTPTPTAIQAPYLSLDRLNPVNPQQTGRNFKVDVLMGTGGQSVSGADAVIKYNSALLRVVNVDRGTITGFTSYPALTHDAALGQIRIAANIGTGTNTGVITSEGLLGSITFTPLAPTTSTVLELTHTLGNRNDSNIVLYDPTASDGTDILSLVKNSSVVIQGSAITQTPSPTGIATPTLTPTGIPTVSPTEPNGQPVLVKYRMQGKIRAGVSNAASMDVKYKVIGTSGQITSLTLAGNTNGEVQLSMIPNSYKILLDTAGYLAKSFGTQTQPIVIAPNTTQVDLTTIPLLGGDFNDDNIINEIDYTLHFLTNYGGNNKVVDLDASGLVNNLDFAIMRNNWNKQSDIIQ